MIKTHEPVTIERVERSLLILARIMDIHGEPAYLLIYERLEQELETLKNAEANKQRVRRRLDANRHLLSDILQKPKR